MNTLTLGFSPCPNDTFIFDALVNGGIDTGPVRLQPVLEDVETLNEWALEGKLDITKLSFPAFFRSASTYQLLDTGSALGKGVGPLLVARENRSWTPAEINRARIALPGAHTTAHLLFGYAFPEARHKAFMIFSAIEDAVLSGDCDLGVLIHENRFTYAEKGLHRVRDLGAYWEESLQVPVPLGGIAIRRSLGADTAKAVSGLLRQSLDKAWASYPALSGYVSCHAQAMQEDVMRRHIELYVNDFTRSLGQAGRQAILEMAAVYGQMQGFPPGNEPRNLFA